MTEELIDICFNFTHKSFRRDEEDVLRRAINVGVTTLMVTGASAEESCQAIELAERYPEYLYASVGVHPHLSRDWNRDTFAHLRELAQHDQVKAIGEAGLDYNRNFSPPEAQRHAFERQIELACDLGLPLFLHERDAHQDLVTILRPYLHDLHEVVVHCFTGTGEQLDTYLKMDFHIGITGWICDMRRGHHLHELVKRIPLNRLMIETDAPYLLPRDLVTRPKDRRNEPSFLPHILRTIAMHMGLSVDTVGKSTTQTARRFFRLHEA